MIDITKESEARNNDLYEVNCIITIIINCITCPLTVALNVLVIMAVKRRPRLQSNTNILLACLAATDVLTGLTTQSSFILWKIFELLGMTIYEKYLVTWHRSSLRTLSVCSCLHLMLVTCERLIAIKFTMRYPYLVTKRSIKVAVIAIWVFTPFFEAFSILLLAFIFLACTVFIPCSYVILYRETLRHTEKIKTQQLPQEELERMAKESKALKTTVLVVGAVVLCLLPPFFFLVLSGLGMYNGPESPLRPWIRTFVMLNSFLNPLIYCWRQREIRNFVLRSKPQFVFPAN